MSPELGAAVAGDGSYRVDGAPWTVAPTGVDHLLVRARDAIAPRPGPADLDAVWAAGGLVVDIRPVDLRERDGLLPGALVVDRNVLEWRLDPTGEWRLPEVTGPDQQVVLTAHIQEEMTSANDDGSGCGNLLEIGRALTRLRRDRKPKGESECEP